MIKKIPFYLSLAIVCVLLAYGVVNADVASQAYTASTTFTQGSVVSLKENSLTEVELSTSSNTSRLLGVVVDPSNALINLNSDNGNTQVVVNGQTTVLVSDINGEPKSGDTLTSSPIAGVAMKATESGKSLGVARGNFSDATQVQSKSVVDRNARQVTTRLGVITMSVSIGDYNKPGSVANNPVVNGLQDIAFETTGKSISTTRAIIAIVILAGSVIVSIIILYTSILSSIRSIGRNPLSKHAVLLGLVQVIVAVVAIMLSGLSITYLIITR